MTTIALFAALAVAQTPLVVPSFPREFRAVWVATVANIDWPSKPGVSTEQAKSEMLAILDKAKELNINALVWQIRPSADALYASKLEPWSEFLTGQQGRAPRPYWDPLAFLVKEAHRRGIEIHTWFNPYRAKHPIQKGETSMDHVSNSKPEIVKKYGKFLWMDPGERETQRHTMSVILDVVKRYDIDGVHIDDYFYPYKEKDAAGNIIDFPDDRSYLAYTAAGGKMARDDWRRANVDNFIRDMYEGVKKVKPWVKVGISPFGIYRPGIPAGIMGFDQYTQLYADPLKWFRNGWLDYLTPQLYWRISDAPRSYTTLLDWWAQQNVKGRNFWPGNYTSKTDKIETQASATWPAKEIEDQVVATRNNPGSTGNVHFSMRAIMRNAGGIADTLRRLYAEPALVPASPWLASGAVPKRPNLRPTGDRNGGRMSFFWSAGADRETLRWLCVYSLQDGRWSRQVVSAEEPTLTVSGNPTAVAISVVDRVGNESDLTAWPAKYRPVRKLRVEY